MRIAYFAGLVVIASFAVGADDAGGCGGSGASINFPDTQQTADGGGAEGGVEGGGSGGSISKTWPTPPVPSSGSPQPMTCAWLDGDNCWKRVVTQIEACSKGAAVAGPFTADRRACTHPDGSRTEFAGPIDSPPSTVQVVDNRILDPDGAPCMTGKILGIGKVAISSSTESVLFESTSLTDYQVTCSDGTTYANYGDGVCPSFGGYYLAGKTPGTLLSCNKTSGACDYQIMGGPIPNEVVSRCEP